MTYIKYITLEDWEREWKTKFLAVYNRANPNIFVSSDDYIMSREMDSASSLFTNCDWELAALPGEYWSDRTMEPAYYRSGSVCLNSRVWFYKWIPTLVMPPPVLATVH